ncbi:hypothetical protein EC957_010251, partial [Mortierella hygrophila]
MYAIAIACPFFCPAQHFKVLEKAKYESEVFFSDLYKYIKRNLIAFGGLLLANSASGGLTYDWAVSKDVREELGRFQEYIQNRIRGEAMATKVVIGTTRSHSCVAGSCLRTKSGEDLDQHQIRFELYRSTWYAFGGQVWTGAGRLLQFCRKETLETCDITPHISGALSYFSFDKCIYLIAISHLVEYAQNRTPESRQGTIVRLKNEFEGSVQKCGIRLLIQDAQGQVKTNPKEVFRYRTQTANIRRAEDDPEDYSNWPRTRLDQLEAGMRQNEVHAVGLPYSTERTAHVDGIFARVDDLQRRGIMVNMPDISRGVESRAAQHRFLMSRPQGVGLVAACKPSAPENEKADVMEWLNDYKTAVNRIPEANTPEGANPRELTRQAIEKNGVPGYRLVLPLLQDL